MKEYEGLTPVEKLNLYRNRYHAEGNATENGIIADALNDLLPRMILPPCKIGDKIYMLVTKRAKIEVRNRRFTFIKESTLTYYNLERVLRCYGTSVFLTRTGAEAALECMTKKEDTP